jgi:hypothetical protein
MKFFIVTCIKEHRDDVCKLFKQAEINVFSATDVVGFKDSGTDNILLDWFAKGEEKFDSLIMFSFTSNESAVKGMQLIKEYNKDSGTNFPVRAFIVPVEISSY